MHRTEIITHVRVPLYIRKYLSFIALWECSKKVLPKGITLNNQYKLFQFFTPCKGKAVFTPLERYFRNPPSKDCYLWVVVCNLLNL